MNIHLNVYKLICNIINCVSFRFIFYSLCNLDTVKIIEITQIFRFRAELRYVKSVEIYQIKCRKLFIVNYWKFILEVSISRKAPPLHNIVILYCHISPLRSSLTCWRYASPPHTDVIRCRNVPSPYSAIRLGIHFYSRIICSLVMNNFNHDLFIRMA